MTASINKAHHLNNSDLQTKEIHMNEDNKMMMERYGITSETKMMYFYKEFRYEDINDAIRFAERDFTPAQEIANNTIGIPTEK